MQNHQVVNFFLREHFIQMMFLHQQQQANIKNLPFGIDAILGRHQALGARLFPANKTQIHYRRNRTVYTDEQLETLEHVFRNSMYLVGPERKALASKLSLKEIQIKVWFQNRRIKYRKQKRLAIEDISR